MPPNNSAKNVLLVIQFTVHFKDFFQLSNVFNGIGQWFSTFSVPWPIFQPKLTSQPTLVNKIKFPSQNHSVLQKNKKKVFTWNCCQFSLFLSQNHSVL